jgi:hypothetical protein
LVLVWARRYRARRRRAAALARLIVTLDTLAPVSRAQRRAQRLSLGAR